MRILVSLVSILTMLAISACDKDEEITTDPSVKLEFSADSILFDTVFTSLGSTTQRVKIFNRNSKAVRIDQIKLMGGNTSSYQININGLSATDLSGIELRGNDSLNLFVKVTINPNSALLPFIVKDSITFLTNGNQQKLVLSAFGKNARFLKDVIINANTSWDSDLPYVIYNNVKINPDKILTIKKGTKIFFHKDAELVVEGTLRVEGELQDSVIFASDRLERIYADESGQWKGIKFLATSKDNAIRYAVIKNGIIGIQAEGTSQTSQPKILLVNTIIKNMELAGILSENSSLDAFNNIIINCGKHLFYAGNGGKYNFKQNTFSNSNASFLRLTPSVFITDASQSGSSFPLNIELVNNIIWGNLQDELIIERKGTASFSQLIKNNLIRSRSNTLDQSNILNADPLFKSSRNYNFQLNSMSPASNKGSDLSSDSYFNTWLNKDLNGRQRLFPSDLGSYELL